jgi:ATP/maltotriose-dependent transcriptional regulator MalT
VEHDLGMAARLVTALGLCWTMRGRLAGQGPLLCELAGRAGPGSQGWCAAQFWLAYTAMDAADLPQSLQRCVAVVDAIGDRGPSRVLADCLALQSVTLANLGRVPEAAGCARRALAMARELGYPYAQAYATNTLAIVASYAGDPARAVQLARHSGQIPGIPRPAARACGYLLAAFLAEAGDLAAAEQACAATLAQARDAGDLYAPSLALPVMADLDVQAGRASDAAAHLREAAQLSLQTGAPHEDYLDLCGYLCAATGRAAEAVTLWAAYAALYSGTEPPRDARRREEPLRAARQALGPERARAA